MWMSVGQMWTSCISFMFGLKALMKGTIFADVFCHHADVFFKLPTQLKMTPFHIMSLSQNAIVFSVNGTQQNKELKMHHCWC